MKWHYTVAAHTDVGTAKAVNQDSLTVKVANTICGEAAFAVICDGMGGFVQPFLHPVEPFRKPVIFFLVFGLVEV